jgi:hypothetical protein
MPISRCEYTFRDVERNRMKIDAPSLSLLALVIGALALPGPSAAQGSGPAHRFRLLEGPPDTPPRECPAAGTVLPLADPPPKLRSGAAAPAEPAAGSTEALAQAVRLVKPELATDRELALELGVEKDLLTPDHCGGKPGVRVTLTALTHQVAAYRVRFVSPGGEVETEAEARVAAGERVAVAGPGKPDRCRMLVIELVRGAQLYPVEPVEPAERPSLTDPPG